MKIVIKKLDCWNLWLFLTTCAAIHSLLDSGGSKDIVIISLDLPHRELLEKKQYVLMSLFHKIFRRQNIVIDNNYQIADEDTVLDEHTHQALFLPNDQPCMNSTHRAGLGFVRSQMLKGFDRTTEFSQDPKILFISRSTNLFNKTTETHPHWTNRIIKNNDEIKAIVRKKYKGEIFEVDKEKLPNAMDQLNRVRRADILFGIHGAGLNWIIGARDDSCLYEFFPSNIFQFNGANLCRNLGLGYNTRQIEHLNNEFDLEQVFDGLDTTIKLWKK